MVASVAACAGPSQPAPSGVEPGGQASVFVVSSAEPTDSAPPPAASSAATPEPSRTELLEVAGYEPSVVITPSGEHPGARPLVIVAHGAGGRPEPHCRRYSEIVRGRGFILCTRGRPTDKHLPFEERGYFYDGHHKLGEEVRLATKALTARYGERVDMSDVVYAGYSQGATMGILYLQQGGAKDIDLARVLLVEGGSAEWSIGLSAKLKSEGVDRVAIVCGQVSCRRAANQSASWILRGGLELSSTYAEGAGHVYDGPVAPLVDAAWTWLVESDPRWSAP